MEPLPKILPTKVEVDPVNLIASGHSFEVFFDENGRLQVFVDREDDLPRVEIEDVREFKIISKNNGKADIQIRVLLRVDNVHEWREIYVTNIEQIFVRANTHGS
jgi:hypothetical protein